MSDSGMKMGKAQSHIFRCAVCPGSYDPPTVGHTDVIRRAAGLFDEITVLVCINSAKNGMFSADERVMLLKDALSGLSNVKIEVYDGLLIGYVASHSFDAIIKGIRNTKDYTYENEMAEANRILIDKLCVDKDGINKPCETVFMLSKPENAHVSSTLVRELLHFGAPIDGYADNTELLIEMYNKHKA